MMKTYIAAFFILIAGVVNAQHPNSLIRNGNSEYAKSNYTEAEKQYRKALEKKKDAVAAQYNLANALYKQKRYKEAAKLYDSISKNPELASDMKKKMHYNMGNAYLNDAVSNKSIQSKEKQELLLKSIEGYKNALKTDPKDKDAKYNLSYAKKLLVAEQNKQNQQNKNQQQKQQNQQNQQNKQNQNQDKKNDDKGGEKQQPAQQKMSKEDAERMLKALQNKEKQNMQKTDKQEKGEKVKIQKDW